MHKGNKIIKTANTSLQIVMGTLNYETLLSRLEKLAGNFEEVELSKNDEIFKYCTVNELKNMAEKTLNKLQIVLVDASKITISDVCERQRLLKTYHDDKILGGHTGAGKLFAKLASRFYWRTMKKDVFSYVKQCEICALSKARQKTKEPMTITPTPQKPFDVVIIYTIGPLTISDLGNKYAITLVCDLSKYLIAVSVQDKSAQTVARAISENFILKHGIMKKIISDCGTEYVNELIKELCKLFNIQHDTSTPYHHQTLGAAERNHRTFNEYLRSYLKENFSQWDVYLKYFCFCYNLNPHGSFENKFSPHEIVYGYMPTLPNELTKNTIDPIYNIDNYIKELKYRMQITHNKVHKLLEKSKLNNKKSYDKNVNPLNVKVGDKVLIEIEPYDKHRQKYAGPYIIKSMDNVNVEIEIPPNKTKCIHKNKLIKA